MKGLIVIAALSSLGLAQDATMPVTFYRSQVMGKAVKNAPYTADEITESVQTLGDGTKISHQTQTTVYRDGEGRVRRDNPNEITIFDPVEGVSYTLNPKTMTARKSSMGALVQAQNGVVTRTVNGSYSTSATSSDPAVQAKVNAALDKMKAETEVKFNQLMAETSGGALFVRDNPAGDQATAQVKVLLDQVQTKLAAAGRPAPGQESLGEQVMEGLTAQGTRTTTTLDAGVIGNDRPIKTVSERWYSPDLQTVVMTKRSDPRTGEETFHLTNVRRGEPGADLFLLPPGYQLISPPVMNKQE